MSARDRITIVEGSDGRHWWTLDPNPTAASYHGTVQDTRGFDTPADAVGAAVSAADEIDRQVRAILAIEVD